MSNDNGQSKRSDDYRGRLIEDRSGQRRFTLDALREKIVGQFLDETMGREDILAELDTPAKRRAAIAETTDYVLATEYVWVTIEEKHWLNNAAYTDIFRLGPLDVVLSDESVSEISISNPQEVHIRRGFGELGRLNVTFETNDHFAQLLQNLLAPMGVDITADPFVEVGTMLDGRPLRFSLIGPPINPYFSGLIRLHPSTPLQFEIPDTALELLRAIVMGGHGLLIVGDGGVGKTTLFSNLLQYAHPGSALIQRGGEVHPTLIPQHMQDYPVIPLGEPAATAFEKQINKALDEAATALFIDEIQGDEGQAFWRALTTDMQMVVTFRGRANVRRLHSAISMAVRKSHRTVPQEVLNNAFLQRLPFVAILADPRPQLTMIGQWAPAGDTLTIEPLFHRNPEPERTNIEPCRDLERGKL